MNTESITLYYRAGSSDKVYHAAVDERPGGYVVNFAYGRRGATMQTGTKTFTPVTFDDAKKIYNKLVREKTQKGYTPGANGTPYSSTENAQRSTGILPQLLNPVDERQLEKLLNDSDFWMQEKLDGRRVIIQAGENITGINRKGLTIGLPESIVNSAAKIGVPFTLDGEAIGDTFHAFDLLEFNGVNYRTRPFKERYTTLVALIGTGVGSIELVPVARTAAEKRADFSRLKTDKAEGVVFKRVDAQYTPGRPASGGPQLKFKFVATGTFIVAGVNAGKRSVGLEVINATGHRQYVGNVTVPVNQPVPNRGALVECRYLYAYREGCLYQPLMLGIRDDLDASACTIEQLKYRSDDDDDDDDMVA
ncbi:MAG: WGR domain-containing protein [Planctomycetota bacterium]